MKLYFYINIMQLFLIHPLFMVYCLLTPVKIMQSNAESTIPIVINTWGFINGTIKAWDVVYSERRSALDAVEEGCSKCEEDQCDHTVGYGGSPDENGETTLDAMIMDGVTHDVGAVAALRRVKNAISVARKVLHHTEHSLLVGDQATQFAVNMGFKSVSLSSNVSIEMWKNWKKLNCQPNYWKNVEPDPQKFCGPYKPSHFENSTNDSMKPQFGYDNHDTIGMVVIDFKGQIAAGTSSNGAKYKIPGRVGDSPIPGAGAYVDQDVGGAAATGDGDVMMRFLPTFHAVENMRNGMDPTSAADDALHRIVKKYPTFSGAIVATTIKGQFGAACHGIKEFPFSVATPQTGQPVIKYISCIHP